MIEIENTPRVVTEWFGRRVESWFTRDEHDDLYVHHAHYRGGEFVEETDRFVYELHPKFGFKGGTTLDILHEEAVQEAFGTWVVTMIVLRLGQIESVHSYGFYDFGKLLKDYRVVCQHSYDTFDDIVSRQVDAQTSVLIHANYVDVLVQEEMQ